MSRARLAGDPRERKRLYNAAYKLLNFTSPPRWVHGDARADAKPDPAILLARDLLFAQPQSLTAQLMGDPRPGRSALDQRQQTTKKESPA